MITIPGAISRKGETKAVEDYLIKTFSNKLIIKHITSGTIDGGDILFTGKKNNNINNNIIDLYMYNIIKL